MDTVGVKRWKPDNYPAVRAEPGEVAKRSICVPLLSPRYTWSLGIIGYPLALALLIILYSNCSRPRAFLSANHVSPELPNTYSLIVNSILDCNNVTTHRGTVMNCGIGIKLARL